MAGRYLITGVQLGMLIGLERADALQLADKIERDQYVGYSQENILTDVKKFNNTLAMKNPHIPVIVGSTKYLLTETQVNEIKRLLGMNQKIVAIKYIRGEMDLGLKEAKDLVESV